MHWPTPSTRADDDATGGRDEPGRGRFWRNAAYLTSLGWMIALPIGLGVVLGRVLDDHFASGSFWTLALLGAGIGVAALQVLGAAEDALRQMRHD